VRVRWAWSEKTQVSGQPRQVGLTHREALDLR
jgi:hypothetical protein